jgi:hypothetical protein
MSEQNSVEEVMRDVARSIALYIITPSCYDSQFDERELAIIARLKPLLTAGRIAGVVESMAVVDAAAKRFVGNTQTDGTRSVEVYHYGIGCERAWLELKAILTEAQKAREQ